MKRSARRPSVMVTTGGKGVVSHVGARLLCELVHPRVNNTDVISWAHATSSTETAPW